jgi:hypothetical protein
MAASGDPEAAIREAMSCGPELSEIRYELVPRGLCEVEAFDTEETVESIDAVLGMVAVGSCRVGLDEVDILGEFGGELKDEAPLSNGSLTVLAVAVGVGRGCERAFARAAAAPFSAISSFSASAAAASRISSSRGSGATLLAGLGARGRSVVGEVESATMIRPWT